MFILYRLKIDVWPSRCQDLLLHEEGENARTRLPQLDAPAELAITSQSVASYASSLDRPHLQRLSSRIASDTTRWLSHMFRFVFLYIFASEKINRKSGALNIFLNIDCTLIALSFCIFINF